jgi:hypothetical protein
MPPYGAHYTYAAAPIDLWVADPDCGTGGRGGRSTDNYQIDDGSQESSIGCQTGCPMFWLTQYSVLPGAEVITHVNIGWGADTPDGAPAEIYIWSDPNQDGDPTNGRIMASAAITVSQPGGTVVKYDIDDTFVGIAGTSFFVGAFYDDTVGVYPAGWDNTTPVLGRNWIADNTPTDPGTWSLLEDIGLAGNWMVRANAVGLPCDYYEIGRITSVDHEVVEDCVCKDFPEATAPGVYTGDTCGAINDCNLSLSEDLGYTVTVPNDGYWTFSLCTEDPVWDSYIYLGSECCLADIDEDDDGCGTFAGLSEINGVWLAAGDYWLEIALGRPGLRSLHANDRGSNLRSVRRERDSRERAQLRPAG